MNKNLEAKMIEQTNKILRQESLDLRADDKPPEYYIDEFDREIARKSYQAGAAEVMKQVKNLLWALEFYTEEVNVAIQIKDNGAFYIEECNDISSDCSYGATARKALAEWKEVCGE